jgi:hypothetical protein
MEVGAGVMQPQPKDIWSHQELGEAQRAPQEPPM